MRAYKIHVFISHAWSYSDHYETLASWIFEERWQVGETSLNFINFSIPKEDPIHNARNEKELQVAIYNQITKSHVIVIPSGMYTSYSKWIKEEIGGAKIYGKPILAVNPFGQERRAGVVLDNANEGVGWNKKSVINGIWNLYRNQAK